MSQAREQGFVSQTIVSALAHGYVVVSLYRSSYADGMSDNGGGVLLFNDEGKATHVRTLGGPLKSRESALNASLDLMLPMQ